MPSRSVVFGDRNVTVFGRKRFLKKPVTSGLREKYVRANVQFESSLFGVVCGLLVWLSHVGSAVCVCVLVCVWVPGSWPAGAAPRHVSVSHGRRHDMSHET